MEACVPAKDFPRPRTCSLLILFRKTLFFSLLLVLTKKKRTHCKPRPVILRVFHIFVLAEELVFGPIIEITGKQQGNKDIVRKRENYACVYFVKQNTCEVNRQCCRSQRRRLEAQHTFRWNKTWGNWCEQNVSNRTEVLKEPHDYWGNRRSHSKMYVQLQAALGWTAGSRTFRENVRIGGHCFWLCAQIYVKAFSWMNL